MQNVRTLLVPFYVLVRLALKEMDLNVKILLNVMMDPIAVPVMLFALTQ